MRYWTIKVNTLLVITIMCFSGYKSTMAQLNATAENSFYSVTVKQFDRGKEVILDVYDKMAKRATDIAIKDFFESISDLLLVADRTLIVIGRLPRAGNVIWIWKLDSNKLINSIWCYGYSLSPDKSRIAYQSYYGPMELPEYRRSICLVYDVAKNSDWYNQYLKGIKSNCLADHSGD